MGLLLKLARLCADSLVVPFSVVMAWIVWSVMSVGCSAQCVSDLIMCTCYSAQVKRCEGKVDTRFCKSVIANGSVCCRSLAVTTAVLKTRWASVKLVVAFPFFSFGLPLAIAVVVVVGKLLKEREKRETITDAIVAAIDRTWLRIEQL